LEWPPNEKWKIVLPPTASCLLLQLPLKTLDRFLGA
jgi:hypothetical protein